MPAPVSMCFATFMGLSVGIGLFGNVECGYPCPAPNGTLIIRSEKDKPKSEFICDFQWTNKNRIKHDVLDRMANREGKFLRFMVPVTGYNNPLVGLFNYTGIVTWVSVLESHKYMLRYPHNFQILSLGTMGIIVENIDKNNYYRGACKPHGCSHSCGIGKYELEEILLSVAAVKAEYELDRLCLYADYGLSDIASGYQRGLIVPDLLYYWQFLRMFYSKRPKFGLSSSKFDIPNYYCYTREDTCEIITLQGNYYVIPLIACLFWLYSPLLIHYFPSSQPVRQQHFSPSEMFPFYKTPVYLGRFLQFIICYYSSEHQSTTRLKVFIRRLLFFTLLALIAFRLIFSKNYLPHSLTVITLFVSALFPKYLSRHIKTKLPSAFPVVPFIHSWPYPRGLIKGSKLGSHLTEYQLLSHVMQERIYLFSDYRFWRHLLQNSFSWFLQGYKVSKPSIRRPWKIVYFIIHILFSFTLGLFCFLWSSLIVFTYFLVPLPFFFKEWVYSIWSSVCMKRQGYSWFVFTFILATNIFYRIVLTLLLAYIAVTLFFLTYLISELTMYTYMGAVITPDMAPKYITLGGAALFGIYSMVRDLHEGYDQILNEITSSLTLQSRFKKLSEVIDSINKIKLRLVRDESLPDKFGYDIRAYHMSAPYRHLLSDDGTTIYISYHLYFNIVEKVRPIRRQVLFLLIKVIVMIFFILVAMYIKNVFHMEKKVSSIFTLANSMAIFFLPGALQLLAYKNHFGKKFKELLKREVHAALVEYIEELSYEI